MRIAVLVCLKQFQVVVCGDQARTPSNAPGNHFIHLYFEETHNLLPRAEDVTTISDQKPSSRSVILCDNLVTKIKTVEMLALLFFEAISSISWYLYGVSSVELLYSQKIVKRKQLESLDTQ